MKRYLLFTVEQYYPSGGWGDFVAASDNLEELKRDYSEDKYDRRSDAHIVDLEVMDIIAQNFGEGWQ